MHPFPDDFLWGVATAGHQTEGDNTASDTWFVENVQPSVFQERSGAACNGFELWRDDVDLAAGLGLDAYRFSVEWARVEPAEGEFAAAALEHYAAIVDRCLERGMAPVVTFSHFTSPHWFAARASWLNPEAPALFARFWMCLTLPRTLITSWASRSCCRAGVTSRCSCSCCHGRPPASG